MTVTLNDALGMKVYTHDENDIIVSVFCDIINEIEKLF